jgi:hypothetical protein
MLVADNHPALREMTYPMTTVRKKNAELPEQTAELLKKLRAEDRSEFHAFLLALREARWPYRAIGDVFGVTRAAVRTWYVQAAQDPFNFTRAEAMMPQVPPLPASTRGSKERPKRLVPDVPADDQKRIADLTLQAREVKRWTPVNSPARAAALELEGLLHFYSSERRVPISRLAKYAGVTRRAVAQRIEKEAARRAE